MQHFSFSNSILHEKLLNLLFSKCIIIIIDIIIKERFLCSEHVLRFITLLVFYCFYFLADSLSFFTPAVASAAASYTPLDTE